MSRKLSLVLLVLALVGGSAFASKVTNVELAWQDGFTVATVSVDGPVRFSHQTEEAKDGKPFRIILDVLSATHHLGAKNFFRLPSSPVAKLRTSQYAVKPEKVVRLVFDMKAESVYKVSADNGTVKVYFPDKSGKSFASWSTSAVVAGMKKEHSSTPKFASTTPAKTVAKHKKKTASQINAEINADRLSALQSSSNDNVAVPKPKKTTATKSVSKTVKRKTVVKKTTPKVMASGEVYGPEFDAKLLDPPTPKPMIASNVNPKNSKSSVKSTIVQKKNSAETSAKKSVALKKAKEKPASTKQTTKAIVAKPTTGSSVTSSTVATKKKAKISSKNTFASTATSTKKVKADHKTTEPAVNKNSSQKKTKVTNKKSFASTDSHAGSSVPSNKTTTSTKKVKADSKGNKTVVKKSSSTVKSKPVVAKKNSSKQSKSAKKSTPVLAKKKSKKQGVKAQPTMAKADKPAKSTKKAKSTARFRRSPTRPTKIKGTLVAEFPKRLVIKYKARNRRDPFETLINESKLYDSPVGKRLANVEGLRLVGVIESEDRPNHALVEDEGGYGYILKEGDKVQKGYVLRVTPEKVYFQIFEYGWSRTVALNIDPNK